MGNMEGILIFKKWLIFMYFQGLKSETGQGELPKVRSSPRKALGSSQKVKVSPNKFMGSPQKSMESPRKSVKRYLRSNGSPRKKMKLVHEPCLPRKGHQPPLVVILEDVESFPANVLHDLILICRYVTRFSVLDTQHRHLHEIVVVRKAA